MQTHYRIYINYPDVARLREREQEAGQAPLGSGAGSSPRLPIDESIYEWSLLRGLG
jgi:argininosuccinate lyase